MLDLLAAHTQALRGPGDIDEVVARWGEQLESDDRLAGLLYRTSFQSYLGGQLMVREVELDESDAAPRALREDPFLAMPFEAAVSFFRSKNLISVAEFDALRDRYREGGFIARRLATERLVEVARRSIGSLLDQGLTLDEVYAAIRDAERDEVLAMGIAPAAPHYLDTVVRTNVATSYGAGRWEAVNAPEVASLRPFLRYVTAGDEAVRPAHRALHGRIFRVGTPEAAYYAPPLGFNCFPAGTVVEGLFDGAYRASYDGEIVEITTKHGRRLSVTPNHPVATVHGFAPAGAIHEGDQLLCYEAPVDLDEASAPEWTHVQEEHAPAAIEQVFGAFANSVACRVRDYRPEDFDGDARFMRGEVDVVGAPGQLALEGDPGASEDGRDRVFVTPNELGLAHESGDGASGDLVLRVDAASRGLPRRATLPLDGGPVELRPLQSLRVGSASRLDAARDQSVSDQAARDAEFFRDLLLRGSRRVGRDDAVRVDSLDLASAVRPKDEPSRDEPLSELVLAQSNGVAEARKRLPGLVLPDEVVRVERRHFSGHVYDLQSPRGWIVASGIVTSNCRCSFTTLSQRQMDARGYVLTEGRIAGVDPDDGWSGAPRPLAASDL